MVDLAWLATSAPYLKAPLSGWFLYGSAQWFHGALLPDQCKALRCLSPGAEPLKPSYWNMILSKMTSVSTDKVRPGKKNLCVGSIVSNGSEELEALEDLQLRHCIRLPASKMLAVFNSFYTRRSYFKTLLFFSRIDMDWFCMLWNWFEHVSTQRVRSTLFCSVLGRTVSKKKSPGIQKRPGCFLPPVMCSFYTIKKNQFHASPCSFNEEILVDSCWFLFPFKCVAQTRHVALSCPSVRRRAPDFPKLPVFWHWSGSNRFKLQRRRLWLLSRSVVRFGKSARKQTTDIERYRKLFIYMCNYLIDYYMIYTLQVQWVYVRSMYMIYGDELWL